MHRETKLAAYREKWNYALCFFIVHKETLRMDWLGFALFFCFFVFFLKYTLNLRSHSSWKALWSPRMAVAHMEGKPHKLEERHLFTLCSYLLLSSSPPVTDEHVAVQLPPKIPHPSCYHKKVSEVSIHFRFLPQFSEAILMENRFDLMSGRRFYGCSFAGFFLGKKRGGGRKESKYDSPNVRYQEE